MRRRMPVLSLLVGALAGLMLTACQQPSPVSLEATTDSYSVNLDLDAAALGQRTATIELEGPEPSQVVLAPAMPSMNMTGSETVATKVDDGRYEARGEFFSMEGDWSIEVRIEGPGGQEVATFDADVGP
jgi:hypothetical protein